MAFATVAARQTGSTTTNAATHSVTFPAGVTAGELLLAFVASDGGPILDDSAGRWTKVGGQHRNGTVVTGALFAKIADGNDTLTVRTRVGDANSTEMTSWVTMRVASHGGLPVAVGANGSSTNSNPPALTPPWGSQDYLWIAARMGDAQVPATAAPSGYSNLTGVTHSNTAGACVHTAEKSSAASTEDPGTFTSVTEQWAALTVAVPPATITTPQLVASYEVVTTTSSTTSLVSPSFTPADNELLVVSSSTADASCVPGVPTATGVTFGSQAQAGTSGSFGQSRVSTAKLGTSPGSITVTQPFSGSGMVRSFTVERWKLAKLDATPAVAQATGTGGPSTTVTTEAANSIVSYVCTDWNAVAPGAYLYRGTHTTETGLFDVTTTDVASYFAHQYAPTAGSQTLGLSAPVGQNWSIAGIEIQYEAPSGGGGGGTLGKTDAGASSSASSANKTAVSKFTATGSGSLTAGHARAWLTGSSTGTKVVVYVDSSNAPGALLAASGEVTISNTAEAVIDYTFSSGSIVSGTDYWVGLAWADPGTDSLNLARDNTASARQEANSYAADPFGTPTAQSGPVAVWVEFGTGGGGGTGEITARTPTVVENQTSSIAPDTSTGQVGDCVILTVACDQAINTPTGWTPCFTQINTVVDYAAFYRFLDGGANDDPTVTTSSGTRLTAICQPFGGVDTTTPLDVTPATNGSSSTSVATPSITTVTDGAVAISGFAIDASSATYAGTVSGTGWAGTEVMQTTGTGRRQEVAQKVLATAGATNTATWTQSGGALQMVGFQLALRPAPGGGGGGDTPRGGFFPFMYG